MPPPKCGLLESACLYIAGDFVMKYLKFAAEPTKRQGGYSHVLFSANIVRECNDHYNGLRGMFIFEPVFGIAKSQYIL